MNLASGVWFLFMILIHFGRCCGPAEIGKAYTITSTANVRSSASVKWQLQSGGQESYFDFSVVVLYDDSESNPNSYPSSYVGATTQLTIKNVTKNDGTSIFQHIFDGAIVYNCTLPVYKRASSPTCQPVKLIGNNVTTSCTTAQVYPKAKCQFTLQNEGTVRRDIIDGTSYITYNHSDPLTYGNEYNSTSCTLQYPVDGLKPGNWTVQVNMYPDLTGVSSAQGTVGQADNILMLSIPTISIDFNNCPKGLADEGDTNVRDGYIRQGARATCLCTRDHAGNPPGTVGWSSKLEGSFANLSQSAEAATIDIYSPDNFTCQSTSVLNGSNSMTYTPNYAYGPVSASLTFQTPGPIYLCPNQQTNIDITCQVPKNSFNPSVLFTIRHDNSTNLVIKVTGDTAWSRSVNYNFTKSGQHTFTCRAENAVFNDNFIEASARAMEVYAHPNSPPSFQVTGQNVITDNSGIWVKQGSDISVSCSAGEAYPMVISVNVTCGHLTSLSGQLSMPGVSGDELKCQCTVDHETKNLCNGHNLYKEITIQTAHGPTEVTISFLDYKDKEVQNKPLNLCSSESLDLNVICAVNQSDVRPGLTSNEFKLAIPETFTSQQTYLDTFVRGEYRAVNKLKVTSGGRHILVCEVQNPTFSDFKQTESVTIEVREPPMEPPKISAHSSQHGDVLMVGDDATVTCDVSGGYPSVQSVTLTCGLDKSVTSNGTSANLTLDKIELTCPSINCTCQATHVTGCYDLKANTSLKVNEVDKSPYTTAELVGTAIGSIAGTLILEAVISVIVFIIRREKVKRKNRNKDKEYDEVEKPQAQRYQNVRLRDPNYLAINASESAKQKTEHIYSNQVFGDDADTTEPDSNAYCYIKDE